MGTELVHWIGGGREVERTRHVSRREARHYRQLQLEAEIQHRVIKHEIELARDRANAIMLISEDAMACRTFLSVSEGLFGQYEPAAIPTNAAISQVASLGLLELSRQTIRRLHG